jgi:hypothetical protein
MDAYYFVLFHCNALIGRTIHAMFCPANGGFACSDAPKTVELVLRIAGESPTWGYQRILVALSNLGHDISTTAVANIIKAPGIEPAPDRRLVNMDEFPQSPLGRRTISRRPDTLRRHCL